METCWFKLFMMLRDNTGEEVSTLQFLVAEVWGVNLRHNAFDKWSGGEANDPSHYS